MSKECGEKTLDYYPATVLDYAEKRNPHPGDKSLYVRRLSLRGGDRASTRISVRRQELRSLIKEIFSSYAARTLGSVSSS